MRIDKTRVTLKTIAKTCGYSVNTVSRALRGDTKLPRQTIDKIQSVADELGYIRNSLASSLRSGRSNIIAIIVDNIHNQHYSAMITHLNTLLKQKGYDIIILCCSADDDVEQHLVNIAVSNAADGVLLFPRTNSIHSVKPLIANQIPFVLIDREISGLDADAVFCDDFAGGYLAGQKLIELGHRRFLYLAGALDIESQYQREAGFFAALSDHHIPGDHVRIVSAKETEKAIFTDTMIDLLLPIDYSAILVYKDQTAYSALNGLITSGYRIPEDISIIGFDHIRQDIPFLQPLTSIACSSNLDMAESVVEVLQNRIADPSIPFQKRVLPVHLFDEGTVTRYNECRETLK